MVNKLTKLLSVVFIYSISPCHSHHCFDPGHSSASRLNITFDGNKIAHSEGTTVKYSCTTPGDILIGSESRKCKYGRWTGHMPYCASLISDPKYEEISSTNVTSIKFTSKMQSIGVIKIALNMSLNSENLTITDGDNAANCLTTPSDQDKTLHVICTFRKKDRKVINLTFGQSNITIIRHQSYTFDDESCYSFDAPRNGIIIHNESDLFKYCQGKDAEKLVCEPYKDHQLDENGDFIDTLFDTKIDCPPPFLCPLLPTIKNNIVVKYLTNSLWNDTHAIADANVIYSCNNSESSMKFNTARRCVNYLVNNTLCPVSAPKAGCKIVPKSTNWNGCEPSCVEDDSDGIPLIGGDDGKKGSLVNAGVITLSIFAIFVLIGSLTLYMKRREKLLKYQNSLKSQTYYYEPEMNKNRMKMSYRMGVDIDDIAVTPPINAGSFVVLGSSGEIHDGHAQTISVPNKMVVNQSLSVPNINHQGIENEEDGLGLRLPTEVSRGPSMIVNTSELALNQSQATMIVHGSGSSPFADTTCDPSTFGSFSDIYAVVNKKRAVVDDDNQNPETPNGGSHEVAKDIEEQEVTMLIE